MSTTLERPSLILPAGVASYRSGPTPDGSKAVNILADPSFQDYLNVHGIISGGARGTNTEGDVIRATVDGVDLADIWAEFQATVAIRNGNRQTLIDFLSYGVSEPVETIAQFGGGDDFEEASEFGVPKSLRQAASYFQLGFDFKWFDLASRFTWKYLAEATAAQVESVHQAVLEADNRLVFGEVMRTLFRPTNRIATINDRGYNVYALYNADGTVPPAYKSNEFTGTHTHYLVSGAATIDSGDLDELQDHLTHHGYDTGNGSDLVAMVNKAEGDVIRNFRSIRNGGTARYDFVPAGGQPAFLLPADLQVAPGVTRPAASLRGMKVIGSYGELTIVEEGYIPAGYVACFATGGQAALTNPIGIREHRNPALRGLRLVKTRQDDYPLQDSYYQRGFGTGIRQRGGAALMQIKATGTYEPPAQYV